MSWYWWSQRLGRDHARGWRRAGEDGSSRPRVLLETPDGAEAHSVWSLLDRHGYDVMWCPGPSHRHGRECSLVRTGRCPLVESADLVVNTLDRGGGKGAGVARHLDEATAAAGASSRPVVVVAPQRDLAELSALLPHCDVVPGPLRSGTLLGLAPRATAQRMRKESATAG